MAIELKERIKLEEKYDIKISPQNMINFVVSGYC